MDREQHNRCTNCGGNKAQYPSPAEGVGEQQDGRSQDDERLGFVDGTALYLIVVGAKTDGDPVVNGEGGQSDREHREPVSKRLHDTPGYRNGAHEKHGGPERERLPREVENLVWAECTEPSSDSNEEHQVEDQDDAEWSIGAIILRPHEPNEEGNDHTDRHNIPEVHVEARGEDDQDRIWSPLTQFDDENQRERKSRSPHQDHTEHERSEEHGY